ncbi:MAG: UDP-3-O-acyl-N-acetylglucosamine deacetylase [Pirellulales bacterium]|nr:UDP-3-O-acyl-N-acetylglucosamine deacetylase [Pirellulales bacterium]
MDDGFSLMFTARKQRTLSRTAVVEGFGYWSGRDVRLEFRPAESGAGIVFVRSDLAGCPRIPADAAHRVEVPRRTTLQCGEARVDMVEHVMAALRGLQIDNCEVWADEAEMPGCDGSSLPFVRAFSKAGIAVQAADRRRRAIDRSIRLGDEKSWVEARPPIGPAPVVEYHLDYGPASPIGSQVGRFAILPDVFRGELASARTFMLQEEAAWLRSQGLGRRVTYGDLLIFGPGGPIENSLRFGDECVRHKILDLIGDLALAGCDLVGHFVAYRSGHRLNAELVRRLVATNQCVRQFRRCA